MKQNTSTNETRGQTRFGNTKFKGNNFFENLPQTSRPVEKLNGQDPNGFEIVTREFSIEDPYSHEIQNVTKKYVKVKYPKSPTKETGNVHSIDFGDSSPLSRGVHIHENASGRKKIRVKRHKSPIKNLKISMPSTLQTKEPPKKRVRVKKRTSLPQTPNVIDPSPVLQVPTPLQTPQEAPIQMNSPNQYRIYDPMKKEQIIDTLIILRNQEIERKKTKELKRASKRNTPKGSQRRKKENEANLVTIKRIEECDDPRYIDIVLTNDDSPIRRRFSHHHHRNHHHRRSYDSYDYYDYYDYDYSDYYSKSSHNDKQVNSKGAQINEQSKENLPQSISNTDHHTESYSSKEEKSIENAQNSHAKSEYSDQNESKPREINLEFDSEEEENHYSNTESQHSSYEQESNSENKSEEKSSSSGNSSPTPTKTSSQTQSYESKVENSSVLSSNAKSEYSIRNASSKHEGSTIEYSQTETNKSPQSSSKLSVENSSSLLKAKEKSSILSNEILNKESSLLSKTNESKISTASKKESSKLSTSSNSKSSSKGSQVSKNSVKEDDSFGMSLLEEKMKYIKSAPDDRPEFPTPEKYVEEDEPVESEIFVMEMTEEEDEEEESSSESFTFTSTTATTSKKTGSTPASSNQSNSGVKTEEERKEEEPITNESLLCQIEAPSGMQNDDTKTNQNKVDLTNLHKNDNLTQKKSVQFEKSSTRSSNTGGYSETKSETDTSIAISSDRRNPIQIAREQMKRLHPYETTSEDVSNLSDLVFTSSPTIKSSQKSESNKDDDLNFSLEVNRNNVLKTQNDFSPILKK